MSLIEEPLHIHLHSWSWPSQTLHCPHFFPSSSLIILHHQLARLPPSSIHSPPSPTLSSLLLLYVVSCKRWQLVFSKNPKSPNGGHFGGSLVIFVFVCRPLPPSVNTSFSNHHVGRSISAYNFLYVHHPEPRIIVIRHALNHHLQSAVGIQVLQQNAVTRVTQWPLLHKCL